MKKIRVLHFELDSNPGGIETFLLNLYSNINREIFQFDFITQSNIPAKGHELQELGGNIIKVASYKNPIKYYSDVKNVLSKGYDLVHIHKNSAANIIPFIITGKYFNSRIIAHSHNTRPSIDGIPQYLHRLNQPRLYRLSNEHLACSDIAGKWLYGKRQFKIVQNGINVLQYKFDKKIRIEYRHNFNIEQNSFVILHVGRFTEQKNHKRLIDIFKHVKSICPNAKLMLIGSGPQKDQIKEKVRTDNLDRDVILLENRNDINKLMMAADCLVMPSLYEGLPFVAIEAQAAGLPIFLSENISKESEITNIVNWFSLNDSNDDIARRITQFPYQYDRELYNTNVINSKYNISNTVNMISDIYIELLKDSI